MDKTEEIQKSFQAYYRELYSQPDANNLPHRDRFLEWIKLPRVTDEQNEILMAETTEEEINKAISNLKSGKSPVADGYPAEWYRSLKSTLVPLTRRTFNWVLKEGEIPCSWREPIISLIPKEGRNVEEGSGYRPISVQLS